MTEELRLVKLNKEYFCKYENYILSKQNSLLFHSIHYQQLIVETINSELETVIVIDKADNVQGILPLMSMAGAVGRVYNSLPFYGSNGGFIYDNEAALNLLIDFYQNLLKIEDTCLVMISGNPLNKYNYTTAEIIDNRLCQFTKLDYDNVEAGLMDSFHYKTRNMVRKSQKQGVEIIEANLDFEFLYDTHFENMTAIGGKPKPDCFFKSISKYFRAGTDYKIFIAKKDGIKISALLLFYFNGVVEYYTPVIKAEYRNIQPNSLLIYHAMSEAAKRGYKLWNWGGTWKSQIDLYRFKSRWGAFDLEYNYYIDIKNKAILDLSPEIIAKEYPYFFTIPFNLLHGNK